MDIEEEKYNKVIFKASMKEIFVGVVVFGIFLSILSYLDLSDAWQISITIVAVAVYLSAQITDASNCIVVQIRKHSVYVGQFLGQPKQ